MILTILKFGWIHRKFVFGQKGMTGTMISIIAILIIAVIVLFVVMGWIDDMMDLFSHVDTAGGTPSYD